VVCSVHRLARRRQVVGSLPAIVKRWSERPAEIASNVADDPFLKGPERVQTAAELGVPRDAMSCHTAIVGGYAIEGHVPAEAILTLLAERPDATGLVLPGMPADSPGMGGNHESWQTQPVMLIETDGTLTPFQY